GLFRRLLAGRPALARLLTAARDGERARRHALGDDGARGHVGALADGHRGDQARVGADEGRGADHRLVLVDAVVVAGDGARAEIRTLAHLGVAHVGEMRHLGPPANPGLLDLDEVADLGAGAYLRERAQVAEGAELRALLHRGFREHTVGLEQHAVAEPAPGDLRARADHALGADRGHTLQ